MTCTPARTSKPDGGARPSRLATLFAALMLGLAAASPPASAETPAQAPVQTPAQVPAGKPADAKPAEAKPAEAKPAEAKPPSLGDAGAVAPKPKAAMGANATLKREVEEARKAFESSGSMQDRIHLERLRQRLKAAH